MKTTTTKLTTIVLRPFYTASHGDIFGSQCAGQSVLSDTRSYELEDFVGAKFYFPHALAGGTLHCDLSLIINHTGYK